MNKIVTAVVLVLVVVTGVLVLSNISGSGTSPDNATGSSTTVQSASTSMSTSDASATSTTITEAVASSTGPPACLSGQNASSISSQGLTLLGCFKTSANLGDEIFFQTILRDDSSVVGIPVTGANIKVTDSMGEVAFQAGCVTLENVILTAGGSYECNVVWNTGTPYDGVVASPGTYNVQAYILGVNGMTSEADIQIVG